MLSLLSITPKIGPSLPWYLYITKSSGNAQEMGKTYLRNECPASDGQCMHHVHYC